MFEPRNIQTTVYDNNNIISSLLFYFPYFYQIFIVNSLAIQTTIRTINKHDFNKRFTIIYIQIGY